MNLLIQAQVMAIGAGLMVIVAGIMVNGDDWSWIEGEDEERGRRRISKKMRRDEEEGRRRLDLRNEE